MENKKNNMYETTPNPYLISGSEAERELRREQKMEMAGSSGLRCPVSHCHPIMSSSFVSSIKILVSTVNRMTLLPPRCSSSQPTPTLRSEMSLSVGAHVLPHPNKVERGGEDAYFVSSYGSGAIAVADGVSGWAERNVDPALFSRELMANASSLVEDTEVNYDPQILIRKAHEATSSKGSATVVVAMMEGNGTLKIANVGDCGLRVIRKGLLAFTTCPQEHYFDCPYQLSSEAITQTYLDAVVSTVKLMEGDTIVMGSDGLFDNVYDREIVSIVSSNSNVTEAAKALARLARDYSMDPGYDSPYSLEARSKGIDVPDWKKLLGMKLTGGKLDDITVIVGKVVKRA